MGLGALPENQVNGRGHQGMPQDGTSKYLSRQCIETRPRRSARARPAGPPCFTPTRCLDSGPRPHRRLPIEGRRFNTALQTLPASTTGPPSTTRPTARLHLKVRALVPALATLWLSTACTALPEAPAHGDDVSRQGYTSLTLIPVDNPAYAWRALTERSPAALQVWSAEESAVRETCGAREPRDNGKESSSAVLAPAANASPQWLPAAGDSRLEAALQAHVRMHAQSARRPFYADPERRNTEPAWRCFRYARFAHRDDAEPALDFIGELRLGDSGDYVQLRPLRLYAGAESRTRGIAVGLQLEAVWRQGNVGSRGMVFEPVLLAAVLQPDAEDALYFQDRYWEQHPILPLPPMSLDLRGRPTQTAPATVTVNLVEILSADQADPVLLQSARTAGDHLGALIAAALAAR